MKKIFTLNNLSSGFFYFAILIFLIGFNFTDAPPPSGWYQQFMPSLGGRQITDITFLDSLTGYSTARISADTNYLLKTINGGDNWFVVYRDYSYFNRVQFLNQNTGYICGAFLRKTTNAGLNWFNINISGIVAENMYVLNEDTIWLTDADGFVGGIFLTTNGGLTWQAQANFGSANPDRIYMHNGRFGFADANGGIALYRTTNGGLNWTVVSGVDGFRDIYFADTLTGWKAFGNMKKTTDGGLNWVTQTLPSGGLISIFSEMKSFNNVNIDTIWGGGGYLNYGGGINRGFIYHTSNSGSVWTFQLPDTSFGIPQFDFVNFINGSIGWCYESFFSQQYAGLITSGVHTTTGGNDTFYTEIKLIRSNVPKIFQLFQNYPNPFNPYTKISYGLRTSGYVKLVVYDVVGKEIIILTNNKLNPGIYEIGLNASDFSSGVYFYSLIVDGKLIDTKKMVLIK